MRRISSRPFTSGLSTSTCRSKPARAEQRRVEHLGAVGRAHDDHALARVEAVHLGQQLIERLLALLVAAERALHAHLAERVELVDEDDAGRLGFGLLKQIADAGGADADEHLHELGSAQAEKRHVRLAGHRAREQRLAGARRADQQHALRNPAAEIGVFLRVLEELDDLLQLVLRFVDAGHVGEAHLHLVVGVDLGAAAGERHDAAFGAAHAPEEEAPDADEEDQRQNPPEEIGQPPAGDLAGVLDAARFQLLGQLRVLHAGGRELLRLLRIAAGRLLERAANHLLADRHLDDLAVFQERLELRVGNRLAGRRQVVDLGEHEQQHEREPVPQRGRRPLADAALPRRSPPRGLGIVSVPSGSLSAT